MLLLTIMLTGCLKMPAQEKLSARDFKKLFAATSNALLLDVRTPAEVKRSYIEGAVFLDFHDTAFKKMLTRIDSSQPVFVYCAIGVRSHDAAVMLKELGFSKVYDLKGGIINWKLAGLPVVKAKNENTWKGLDKKQFLELIGNDSLALIDFYAPWCAPCKIMVPALDSMKQEWAGQVKIITINADENLKLMKQLKFFSLPHIMIYKNGNLLFQQDGFMSRKEMEELIVKYR
jgi:thioredoxin 1